MPFNKVAPTQLSSLGGTYESNITHVSEMALGTKDTVVNKREDMGLYIVIGLTGRQI